jgi:alpha-L-fucosidase
VQPFQKKHLSEVQPFQEKHPDVLHVARTLRGLFFKKKRACAQSGYICRVAFWGQNHLHHFIKMQFMRLFSLVSTLVLVLFVTSHTLAQPYAPNWKSLDTRPTPEWWRDAKFGVFIHWGVYSVPAFTPKGRYAEWYQHSLTENDPDGQLKKFHEANFGNRTYYDLANDFHAELFNPEAWAQLFQSAGAKYVVLTSKHHDGYCLWPSNESQRAWGAGWNSVERGPRRDLVGELTTALRQTDVRPGLYYSMYEWYNPMWKADKARYAAEHAIPQLYDLINRYQPDVIWADGDWDASPEVWQSERFLAWLYNDSPVRDRVVANDRWGSGTRFQHGGIYTPEYQPDMDFDNHDWEESRGMGYSYGYNRAEDAWDYNTSQTLILHLIDKVARGGNFLLDIGPDAHGQIPPIMQERLLDIGQWLDINGEAIYATRRWRQPWQWSATGSRELPKAELIDGWKTGGDALLKQTIDPDPGYAVKEAFFTYNPNTRSLYAILPRYPADRRLVLRNLMLPSGTDVTLLSTKEKLRWENASGNSVVINLPEYNPSRMRAPEAFVVRIGNFGAFTDNPKVELTYDPRTMVPTATVTALPGSIVRYTPDGTEPTPSAPQYSTPLTLDKATQIKTRAYRQGLIESNTVVTDVKKYAYMPALTFMQDPQGGLAAKLIRSADGTYTTESIERGEVMATGLVQNFALDPMCANQCGMVWQGYINIEQTGGYQFATNSDDGSMLYIDGQVVVNNDGAHGMTEKTGLTFLQRGWHAFKVTFYNAGGDTGLQVKYGPVGGALTDIPASVLAH